MSFTWLLVLLAVICLCSLAISAGLLWLSCKLFRVPKITYRRSLLVALAAALGNLALFSIRIVLGYPPWPALDVGVDLLGLAIPFVAVGLFLRMSRAKTVGVALVWLVLSVVAGIGTYLGTKQALAEAFINPTGGMAETLWGYHKMVTCPQCQFVFPVNAAEEVAERPPRPVVGCTCPNCRYPVDLAREHLAPEVQGGDRIITTKGLLRGRPERFDVVVFQYPKNVAAGPIIYIKRLVGLPDETLGIYAGKLYARQDHGEEKPERSSSVAADKAASLFSGKDSTFTILRKPPDKILALRRLVYDNDHPAKDLNGVSPPRWAPEREQDKTWIPDEPNGFRHAGGDGLDWLRYRHILRGWDKPELITDFLGYNSKEIVNWPSPPQGGNWVGDLILEGNVTVDKSEGDLVLELSKGVDRFRATWKLSSGECMLSRPHDGKDEPLQTRPTSLTKPGMYQVRFANVDERLTVWVDKSLPFGDGVAYPAPPERAPTANDLQPASIGTRGGAVHVHHLTLWRDTYYTYQAKDTLSPAWADSPEVQHLQGDEKGFHELLSDPNRFQEAFRNLPGTTYSVQPGHYLCLGDNSHESSDSRSWGLVPEPLLLGKAVGIYYPFNRAGPAH